ncbi:GNAT family N-acetyltransferase [Ferrimicrobium sp.]|uniref:GNAT family N-acetyltransferase n=1 Tax=Ferrimicrobium sp. TaxID=2926050 RepID=UPI002621EF30|nr:GNAT family N-acetyltransferase [Ferrimicrobium sp.]
MAQDFPVEPASLHHIGWDLLDQHLTKLLGAWPPSEDFQIVPTLRRREPMWDGSIRTLLGIFSPTAGTLISMEPLIHTAPIVDNPAPGDRDQWRPRNRRQPTQDGSPNEAFSPNTEHLQSQFDGGHQASPSDVIGHLADHLAIEEDHCFMAYFRFAFHAPNLGRPGVWVPADSSQIPEWLHPFGGKVLVAYGQDGRVVAGVGLKHHDRFARELAVVTEPEARGRGLAKALVAQAAECVLEGGMLPTYLHAPSNLASARVAEASGFIDRGWRMVGLTQAGEAQLRARSLGGAHDWGY